MFHLPCALALVLLCTATGAGKADKKLVHEVKKGDTLSGIAQHYRVSLESLRQWNALKDDRIRVGQRLAVRPQQREWYTVRRGDTLSEVAARFGLSLGELRRINQLKKNRILSGQRLRIHAPGSAFHLVRSGETLSEIAQIHGLELHVLKGYNGLEGERIYPGQRLRLTPPPGAAEEEEPAEYTVRRGDTLSEIAQRFELSLELLLRLNRLKGERIYPGQKLRLRPTEIEAGIHMVRSGETLSEIAQRYHLELEFLRRLNGIEGSRILAGQKLRLKAAPAATHMVERGDALWEIARAYGMSVAELKRLNHLRSNRIYPGQELKLNARKAARLATYMVVRGDNLSEIARLHQMSVAELKRLNHLPSAVIHPGEKLRVRPLQWLKISEIDWAKLRLSLKGVRTIEAPNGPYYYRPPTAARQKTPAYYEDPTSSALRAYRRASRLWKHFELAVSHLGRLSDALQGWQIVLDPGHGGWDPGTIVSTMDGQGNKLYVVEDEYVYDTALRAYVLLRLHGARVSLTLLSPNHLIRQSNPPTRTFVNEKNEVYNSYALNQRNYWPRGSQRGLAARVEIARQAFEGTPVERRIFISFHADITPRASAAPTILYDRSRDGRRRDLSSRAFARALLPALGAGARVRGQGLAVLRDNPAHVKVLIELRNLAYVDNAWAMRYEQLRHRDAEKVVQGILSYVRHRRLRARR